MTRRADVPEVRNAAELPAERHSDGCQIRHGYAVHLIWQDGERWFFYRHLEPAWTFLRVARMGEYTEGDLYRAANELKFSPRESEDVRTLYIAENVTLTRGPEDIEVLRRWLARVGVQKFWPGE